MDSMKKTLQTSWTILLTKYCVSFSNNNNSKKDISSFKLLEIFLQTDFFKSCHECKYYDHTVEKDLEFLVKKNPGYVLFALIKTNKDELEKLNEIVLKTPCHYVCDAIKIRNNILDELYPLTSKICDIYNE